MLGCTLGFGPVFQHVPLYRVQLLEHGFFLGIGARQFDTMAVGIKEIDRVEGAMVGHTEHGNTAAFQMRLEFQQLGPVLDLEGDVLHPFGRVRVAAHRRLRGQLEKGQDVTVAGVQEDVHVRIWRLGRGHEVLGDGQYKVHVQVVAVPEHRFPGVLAAVRNMVDAVDFHGVCIQ